MTTASKGKRVAEALYRAAELNAWTPELRVMLQNELKLRGIRYSRFADCGELADTLKLALTRQPKEEK